MGKVELIMPKMGESIVEATIIKWHKNIGDYIELDETILEIATDKVDSEIPSPVAGKLLEILFEEDAIVPIGAIVAYIEVEGESTNIVSENTLSDSPLPDVASSSTVSEPTSTEVELELLQPLEAIPVPMAAEELVVSGNKSEKFYSPLVRNIAKEEGISLADLDDINGSGLGGRVTKTDVLSYISDKQNAPKQKSTVSEVTTNDVKKTATAYSFPSGDYDIIEMDRMRKMIAEHMVSSKSISPHVTSFVEADVTNLVNWRNRVKDDYQKQYGEKLTFTPLFIEAIVKALKDFPKINCAVNGDKIHVYKNLNIGMATALPSGNLIVPVIKQAELLNLAGITRNVNELAEKARNNKLKPDDVKDGTFTVTNVGTFGNVMGTPIINQPQAAILALGAIRKKPAVLETEYGDVIAIRQLMFMSMSYDHRIIDGFLGGSFLKRIADYLEKFDSNRGI